jgi:hypothetical protein
MQTTIDHNQLPPAIIRASRLDGLIIQYLHKTAWE